MLTNALRVVSSRCPSGLSSLHQTRLSTRGLLSFPAPKRPGTITHTLMHDKFPFIFIDSFCHFHSVIIILIIIMSFNSSRCHPVLYIRNYIMFIILILMCLTYNICNAYYACYNFYLHLILYCMMRVLYT